MTLLSRFYHEKRITVYFIAKAIRYIIPTNKLSRNTVCKYFNKTKLNSKQTMRRSDFELPLDKTYLCGNSLGLLPKVSKNLIGREIEKWSTLAVDGHFSEPEPWLHAEAACSRAFIPIVGAKDEHEIVIMGELSTNIHLLLSAFYKPNGPKYKILIEQGAFPSDLVLSNSLFRNLVCRAIVFGE